jgi:hypothetical protein
VSLLDGSGAELASTFSESDGGFVLPRTASARRLSVDLVGRRGLITEIPPAGDQDLVIELAFDPIRLAELNVSVPSRCVGRATPQGEVAVVWGEVQKALRAVSLTRTQGLYRFEIRARDRTVDAPRGIVMDDATEERTVTGVDPFTSLAPTELAARGYVIEEKGETWIYGPSIDDLLSRPFQETHCFSLRRDAKGKLVGLAFEPMPDRAVADIRGVLWLAETDGDLRTLEFGYVHLPRDLTQGRYEGSATFRRLDGGAWAIDRWQMSGPDPDDRTRTHVRTGEIVRIARVR